MPPPRRCRPPPLPLALGVLQPGEPYAAAPAALLVEGPSALAHRGPGHLEMRLRLTYQLLKAPEVLHPLVHSSCTTNTTTFPALPSFCWAKGLGGA